jgi:hypothetical protein
MRQGKDAAGTSVGSTREENSLPAKIPFVPVIGRKELFTLLKAEYPLK